MRDGLHAFPGTLAEACAEALSTRAQSPERLFEALAARFDPPALMAGLGAMRDGGLLCDDDQVERVPAMDAAMLREAGIPVDPGGEVWARVGPMAALTECGTPPGQTWIPVVCDPERIIVGPVFPDEGPAPCITCLAARADMHDDLGHLLRANPGARQVQACQNAHSEAADQVAFVRDALSRVPSLDPGAILIRTAATGVETRAQFTPRGGCPQCKAPPVLKELNGAAVLRDGGYRPHDAALVLERLLETVDPVTGIVRRLDRPDTASAMLGRSQVFVARHAFPLAAPTLHTVLRNRRGRSAGKGQTEAEARTGAIAEAMERFAGVARPGDVVRTARADQLNGPVVLPADWTLYGDAQMADAAAWRGLDQPAAWVPDPMPSDATLAWSNVYDLATGEPGWAPSALCWHEMPPQSGCATPGRADSNGCAAGQARADAQLQGLLELIERDAVGIWWWRRIRRPQIEPSAIPGSWVRNAVAALIDQGYRPALFDLTHDLGIPVVAAVAWPAGGYGPMALGFGAHPSVEVAASRALTEVFQALPDRTPNDIGGDPRRGFGLRPGLRLADASAEDDLAFLIPDASAAAQRGPINAAPDTAVEALKLITDRLRGCGLRVWWLDQSRADVPLPVVRMIVPGLRHFRPRFAAGRLQTVPENLGWSASPGLNRLFIRQ